MKIKTKLNTNSFSQEAMKQITGMDGKNTPIPVTLGYDLRNQIGFVSSIKPVDGGVIVEIEIDDAFTCVQELSLEICGCVRIKHKDNDGVNVIDKFDIKHLSMGIGDYASKHRIIQKIP